MSTAVALRMADDDGLASLTNDQLRRMIREGIEMTARGITQAARAIVELEKRGEDLSEFRRQTVHFLSLVAYRQLLPEAYLQFMGMSQWLKAISQLPMPDQERIASGKTLPLVVAGTVGQKWTVLQVAPRDVQPAKIKQLIGPDGIRSEAEQIAWLESAAVETTKRKERRTLGPITIDRTAGVLKVGQSKLNPAMLVNALAQLNSVKSTDEPAARRVIVRLTEEEYRNLAMHAATDGVDPADLARQAVALFGLMRKPPSP